MRFVTELAKMRAFAELWDEITRERYQVADAAKRRFRYGVQVNSLGLTEQQPENNAYRILIEMLAVVLSRNARARAVQLPAWNEALGLPRPFDQQWSLRLQQIMAYETDLLEFGDIFEGSREIDGLVASLKAEALAELDAIEAMGGAIAAIEFGLHEAQAGPVEHAASGGDRARRADRRRRQPVHRERAFAADRRRQPDHRRRAACRGRADGAAARLARGARREAPVRRALEACARRRERAKHHGASIEAAKAGVTTGEWGATLRAAFGEYRAPTGVSPLARQEAATSTSCAPT